MTSTGERFMNTPAMKAYLKCETEDRVILMDLIRIALRWGKMTTVTIPANLPDATGEFYDWVAGMARLSSDDWITLDAYQQRAKNETDATFHMIAVSDLISRARRFGLVELSERVPPNDTESIHHYRLNEGARAFWTNGLKAGMDNATILKGWRALQGIADDLARSGGDDDDC